MLITHSLKTLKGKMPRAAIAVKAQLAARLPFLWASPCAPSVDWFG
jgi:hypothetical protein